MLYPSLFIVSDINHCLLGRNMWSTMWLSFLLLRYLQVMLDLEAFWSIVCPCYVLFSVVLPLLILFIYFLYMV